MIAGNETVTILRRSGSSLDDFGLPSYTITQLDIQGCLFAPGGGSEPVDVQRDAVDAKGTLYMPSATQVEPGDVFVIRGSEWVKDAPAQEWVSPFTGLETGLVINVRQRNA